MGPVQKNQSTSICGSVDLATFYGDFIDWFIAQALIVQLISICLARNES